jgi:hypothetical protein
MAFKANTTVHALDYDFRPHVDAVGTTPEPSDKAVRHFLYEIQKLMEKMPDTEDPNFIDRFREMSEEDFDALADQVLDLVAEITQGSPTRDEIAALPHRIQRAYINWLRKELTDPEVPSAATNTSVVPMRRGAPTTQRAGS